MTFSDEQLMAYADGELDEALRAQITEALAHDTRLAAKVEQYQALRKRLRDELDVSLTEPIPDQLLATLRKPIPASFGNNNIVELKTQNTVDAARSRRNWSMREWGAMAATLVLGISLGVFTSKTKSPDLFTVRNGALVAQGKLASALNEQLASAQSVVEPVQIGISFNSRSGDYCRTFSLQEKSLQQKQSLAGFACFRNESWRVQALAQIQSVNTESSGYRQAASAMPPAIAALVDAEIMDEPLDAEGEVAARKGHWRR